LQLKISAHSLIARIMPGRFLLACAWLSAFSQYRIKVSTRDRREVAPSMLAATSGT
jgi:hypothetical protein